MFIAYWYWALYNVFNFSKPQLPLVKWRSYILLNHMKLLFMQVKNSGVPKISSDSG